MLARLVPFVANVTRITAADFLNPIQDEVIALYEGSKSIASLLVDGTGDNASAVAAGFASILKGIIIPGGSDSDIVIDVQTAPTTWRVLFKFKLGSIYIRFGVTTAGLLVTYNANYSGGVWNRDSNSARAAALYLYASAFDVLWYDATSSATWASWTTGFRMSTTGAGTVGNGLTVSAGGLGVTGGISTDTALTLSSGDLQVQAGGISALDGTNGNVSAAGYFATSKTISSGTVGAGQSVTLGYAYKDTLPVAACYITNGGAASFQWGFNILSKNRTGVGLVDIVLNNMPTNVVLMPTLRGTGNTGFATAYLSGGTIKVETYGSGGSLADRDFQLLVFGG